MATAQINSEAISLGVGRLLWAPIGTALPTDHTTPLGPEYQEIGATEEGSEFAYEITSEPVEVAESYDPVLYKTTGRRGSLTFAMAENSVRSLTLAFNGGVTEGYGTGASAGIKYTPPAPGTEVRRVLVFESEDNEERWVYKQGFASGSVTLPRRKGATKSTLGVTFNLERPADGSSPWEAFYADSRSGGVEV